MIPISAQLTCVVEQVDERYLQNEEWERRSQIGVNEPDLVAVEVDFSLRINKVENDIGYQGNNLDDVLQDKDYNYGGQSRNTDALSWLAIKFFESVEVVHKMDDKQTSDY